MKTAKVVLKSLILKKTMLSEKIKNFKKILLEYKWFLVFFIVFLTAQIYQSFGFSWDSLVYLLNGKWFCGEEIYFEFLRPPFPALVNCLSGAGNLSKIFSTIFASFVYLLGTILIFKNNNCKKEDQFLFAGFVFLFPTVLFFSKFGSDLLAMAFLIIAISAKNPLQKGLAFGLSTLSRYNFLIYILILIPRLKVKELPKFLGIFFLTWSPWLIFNYSKTGNPFFSIQESLTLNVLQKEIIAIPDLFQILIILFFFATLIANKNIKQNIKQKINLAGFLALIQFIISGIKEARFLNLLVPAQAINISKIENKKIRNVFAILIPIMLLSVILIFQFVPAEPNIPENEFIYNCEIASDRWVEFYPENIIALPLPEKNQYNTFLENGTSIVIYNYENYYKTGFEEIEKENYIIIKSEKCKNPPEKFVLKIS